MLTLIHPTPFWGEHIKSSQKSGRNCPSSLRSIPGLKVNVKLDGLHKFTRTCNVLRVVEEQSDSAVRYFQVEESHFFDTDVALWDCYYRVYYQTKEIELVLVPRTDKLAYLDATTWPQWVYIGSCESNFLRLDLEQLLVYFLANSETGLDHTNPDLIIKLFIMGMSSVTDYDFRESNRIRKLSPKSHHKKKADTKKLLYDMEQPQHPTGRWSARELQNVTVDNYRGAFESKKIIVPTEWKASKDTHATTTAQMDETYTIPLSCDHHHHLLLLSDRTVGRRRRRSTIMENETHTMMAAINEANNQYHH